MSDAFWHTLAGLLAFDVWAAAHLLVGGAIVTVCWRWVRPLALKQDQEPPATGPTSIFTEPTRLTPAMRRVPYRGPQDDPNRMGGL